MAQAGDDEALIVRLANGDRAALSLLYDQYAGAVFALILRIIANHAIAEDLLQEVFVRVWQRANTYQVGRGKVLTWIMGIAHNLAIDEIRRQQRRPQAAEQRDQQQQETLLLNLPTTEKSPEEQAWEHQLRRQMVAVLRQLPEAQRVIIELAYFDGYSQSQIATQLDEPLGTVKTRLRLGMQKLKTLVAEQGLDL